MPVFLSIVIPCFNEEINLRKGVLEKVDSFLRRQSYQGEAIIVDDGSEDGSWEIIEEFIGNHPNFFLIKNPHRGKADTLISGMLGARGRYVLFSDLDQATPIDQLDKFLPWFAKGFDIVIGSRNSQRKGAPFTRLLMAKGFMVLRNLILGFKIADTQCGFKAFERKVVKPIFQRLLIYGRKKNIKGSHVTAGFDVEVLFLAKKLGFKIKEVPVSWNYVETRRVNSLKDSWYGFLDLLKIKINDLKGLYD